MEADLLIHVRDIAHPDTEYQSNDVYGILEQLSEETGLDQPPVIEVWNKADAAGRGDAQRARQARGRRTTRRR